MLTGQGLGARRQWVFALALAGVEPPAGAAHGSGRRREAQDHRGPRDRRAGPGGSDAHGPREPGPAARNPWPYWTWARCARPNGSCSAIKGATSDSYEPTAADVGRFLRVVLVVINTAGAAEAHSAPTAAVLAAPVPAPAPTPAPAPAPKPDPAPSPPFELPPAATRRRGARAAAPEPVPGHSHQGLGHGARRPDHLALRARPTWLANRRRVPRRRLSWSEAGSSGGGQAPEALRARAPGRHPPGALRDQARGDREVDGDRDPARFPAPAHGRVPRLGHEAARAVSGMTARRLAAAAIAAFAVAFAVSVAGSGGAGAAPPAPTARPDGPAPRLAAVAPLPAGPAAAPARRRRPAAPRQAPRRSPATRVVRVTAAPVARPVAPRRAPAVPKAPPRAPARPKPDRPATEVSQGFDLSG